MKFNNRPWHMFIEGDLAGMFHTRKSFLAAKNGILCAFKFKNEKAPEITVVNINDKSRPIPPSRTTKERTQ